MNAQARRQRAQQRGALLIEVLVVLVVCAFGLLGFVGLQARAMGVEFESYQRSQALVLVDDMVHRLNANRARAADYVQTGLVGGGAVQDCSGAATMAARDVCEWGNLIRGAAERRGGSAVGAMEGARGCITRAAGSSDRYVVAVAWQGRLPSAGAAGTCGQGDASFPDATLRRVVSSTVCIGVLNAAGASRC